LPYTNARLQRSSRPTWSARSRTYQTDYLLDPQTMAIGGSPARMRGCSPRQGIRRGRHQFIPFGRRLQTESRFNHSICLIDLGLVLLHHQPMFFGAPYPVLNPPGRQFSVIASRVGDGGWVSCCSFPLATIPTSSIAKNEVLFSRNLPR